MQNETTIPYPVDLLFDFQDGYFDPIDPDTVEAVVNRYEQWKKKVDERDTFLEEVARMRKIVCEDPVIKNGFWNSKRWMSVVKMYKNAYMDLRTAHGTGFPLLSRHMQEMVNSKIRVSQEEYKSCLLSDDPTTRLANVFEVSVSDIKSNQYDRGEYVERDLLARIITQYSKKRDAKECILFTLDTLASCANSSCDSTFSKEKVWSNGDGNHTISLFRLEVKHLRVILDMIKFPECKGSCCITELMQMLEGVWGIHIHEDVRAWML